jgi:hypothetical protein
MLQLVFQHKKQTNTLLFNEPFQEVVAAGMWLRFEKSVCGTHVL